jgi:hypothetical protein
MPKGDAERRDVRADRHDSCEPSRVGSAERRSRFCERGRRTTEAGERVNAGELDRRVQRGREDERAERRNGQRVPPATDAAREHRHYLEALQGKQRDEQRSTPGRRRRVHGWRRCERRAREHEAEQQQ